MKRVLPVLLLCALIVRCTPPSDPWELARKQQEEWLHHYLTEHPDVARRLREPITVKIIEYRDI